MQLAWDDAAWDDLIADLYGSAMDAGASARLPGRFAALTGGAIASLWRLRPHDNAMVGEPATNLPAEAITAYRNHYYLHDPWADAVAQAQYNAILRNAQIMADADYMRSTYYNEFGIQHGMFHLIGALVPLGFGVDRHVGVISILRSKQAGEFDGVAAARLSRALPHIGASFRLREQIESVAASTRTEALASALDAFGLPAIVLDGYGTILRINALAEQIPCIRNAMARRTNPHAVLRLPARPNPQRWAELVAAAARGEAGGKFLLTDQQCSYLGTVTPLPARLAALTAGVPGRVLLTLRPLGKRDHGPLAAATFGLTQAESDVAAALADGLTPTEIAASRDVKISTVRTLLQRAQDKAGCRNLRDLVRLLASLD